MFVFKCEQTSIFLLVFSDVLVRSLKGVRMPTKYQRLVYGVVCP